MYKLPNSNAFCEEANEEQSKNGKQVSWGEEKKLQGKGNDACWRAGFPKKKKKKKLGAK